MPIAWILTAALALACPLAAAAQQPPALTLEQRMKLRCSAAFALVAGRQQQSAAETPVSPPLIERGREYFVRSAASVMEEAGLDRAAIDAALTREARDLVASDALEMIMPVCLQALSEAGL